jgi:uncharacterized membrane protein YphA (DoxX/SURF4 family)
MARTSRADWGLLVLRLGLVSLLLGFHGWARFLRAFHYAVQGEAWTFVAVVERLGFPIPGVFAVLSALSESIGAVLLGLGIVPRLASAIIAFNMAVAVFSEAGKGDPWELPALYLLGAVVLTIAGPGAMTLGGGGFRWFRKKQRWTGE